MPHYAAQTCSKTVYKDMQRRKVAKVVGDHVDDDVIATRVTAGG
jgi:hypothetical protein